jgi:SRSO17 transposase
VRGEIASLVDARLYLPQAWADDAPRGEQAAIPEDARDDRSKTALALEMVAKARRRGLHFGSVGVDGGDGKGLAFLYGRDALGCRFVADVHCNQSIYLQDPAPQVPAWSGHGRRPQHPQAQSAAVRIDHWATEISHDCLSNAPEHTPWTELARCQFHGPPCSLITNANRVCRDHLWRRYVPRPRH